MSLSNSISLLAQRIASEFNSVRNALNLKAHITHTHERSDINGLDSSLTSLSDQIGVVAGDLDTTRQDLDNRKSEKGHGHVIADVASLGPTLTGMQSAIDGKASTVHTHAHSDITDFDQAVTGVVDESDLAERVRKIELKRFLRLDF